MKTETRRARRERRSALPSERLGEQFHKRLASYAAAAGAAGVGILAMAQPAKAKLVYVPIDQGVSSYPGLLLNVEETPVIRLYTGSDSAFSWHGSFLEASGFGLGSGSGDGVVQRAPLKEGTPIGLGRHFAGTSAMVQVRHFLTGRASTSGAWANVHLRYLGFQFKFNGQVHYGWARLTVSGINAVVVGYAYNTVAGQQILAGQTSADPATQPGPEALANRAAPQLRAEDALRPGSLGMLALGSLGLDIWRPRKQELTPA